MPYRTSSEQINPLSLKDRFKQALCRWRKRHVFYAHRFTDYVFHQDYILPNDSCRLGKSKRYRYDICKVCGIEVPIGYESQLLVIGIKTMPCNVCKKYLRYWNGEWTH